MDLRTAHKESTTEMGAHEMSGGRNIQQSGGSMPLFTVTMKSNGSTYEKDRLSRAIHAASIAAGYSENDLFQRFLSLGPSDFRVDLFYPALPKPRTDQLLMIEVLVSSGTDTNRKKGLVAALVEQLGKAGIDPNDIMVFFLETDRASGSFGGGQFAPPVAFA
jgi:Tautomerase enzyme